MVGDCGWMMEMKVWKLVGMVERGMRGELEGWALGGLWLDQIGGGMGGGVGSRAGNLLISLDDIAISLWKGNIPLPSTLLPPCQTSSLGAGRPGGG